MDAERLIQPVKSLSWILVSAPGAFALGGSMSLYRAGLKLALFLPLGVAMPLLERRGAPSGFTDVSSVLNPGLTAWCNP